MNYDKDGWKYGNCEDNEIVTGHVARRMVDKKPKWMKLWKCVEWS